MTSVYDVTKKISVFVSSLSKKDNLEIEAKITPIDEADYQLLKELLSSKMEKKESFSTDYYLKERRITEQDGVYTDTSKTREFEEYLNLDNKTIKFHLSKEESKKASKSDIRKYDFKREKDRISFQDGNISIDLTKVTRDENIGYELELEIISPDKYNEREFGDKISFYFNVITNYLKQTISFCNQQLSNGRITSGDEIKYNLVSRPRDLLKPDVTKPKSILKGFSVSIKADGIQFFLVVYKFGVWLMNQKGDKIRVCHLTDEFQNLKGSIFAGEYIIREKLKKGSGFEFKAVFLPFDTISYKGESVINKNYPDRIKYLKDIYNMEIVCKGVNEMKILEKRIFNLGQTSESFYQGFGKCYSDKDKILYQEDGYIFTPNFSPYVAEGQMKPKRDRTLSKYLDVCKFKPVEKRSMDFLVKEGKIYSYDRQPKVFEDLHFVLDFEESMDGKIVEFFPVFEEDRIILKPERIRGDKKYPNKTETVNEIVRSYQENNPITEETLRGMDTVLMREFNNTFIKSKLINDIEGYVIDIGAGKGGDLAKFGYNSKIKKVLSVEPNKEFSEEFKRRLSMPRFYKFNEKFRLLEETKGEDTEKILDGMKNFFPDDMSKEKLTLTFMISLSFFWSSRDNLQKLANTILQIDKEYKARGGQYKLEMVYYTINGDKVEKVFKELKKNEVVWNTITLKKGGKNQVFVDIEDSKTVSQQIEYLVKLEELYSLVGMKKVYVREPRVVNILMSQSETNYLNLFSYGMSLVDKPIKKEYKLERLFVNTDQGVEDNGRIVAKGDDEIEKIYYLQDNIYRVATIDMDYSLHHSVLKLLDDEYRMGDFDKRVGMVEIISKKIKTLEDVVTHFDIGIKIFDGKKKLMIGEKEEYILLLRHSDGTFEPLIYLEDDTVSYTFDKSSYLI